MRQQLRMVFVFAAGLVTGGVAVRLLLDHAENPLTGDGLPPSSKAVATPSITSAVEKNVEAGSAAIKFPQDAAGAREFFARIQDSDRRVRELRKYKSEITAAGVEVLSAVVEAFPTRDRSQAIRELAYEWVLIKPEAAARWVESLDFETFVSVMNHSNLVTQLSERAPAHTARLLDQLPKNNRLLRHFQTLAWSWAEIDPQAATEWARRIQLESEWIETLPASAERNGAIRKLVDQIKRVDPATAFQWAATVSGDPETQRQLLQQSIYRWNQIDRPAAQAALEGLGISETTKSLLRKVRTSGD